LILPPIAFGGTARRSVEEGNQLFLNGDHKEALDRYLEAQVDLPESPEVQFNIGAALYKQEKYEEAASAFRKLVEEGESGFTACAYYNLGNCKFKLNQLNEALEMYRRAIELDPVDSDPKFNYELTRELLEQQSQQQKGQGSEKEQEEEAKGSQKASAAQSSPSPSPQPAEPTEKDRGEHQQGAALSPTPTPSASPLASAEPFEAGELTKEQLEQLLNYLAGKENAARQPPRRLKNYPKPKRDW